MQVVAVLPIVCSELDWASRELIGILSDNLEKVLSIAGQDKAFFCSNRPELLTQAACAGLTPYEIEITPEQSQPKALLPLLAAITLEEIPTLFLDLRNPFLSINQAHQALNMYIKDNAPVIRLRPPADHPFFLYSATRLKSCGLIHLFEQPLKTGDAEMVTRPFYYDWKRTPLGKDGLSIEATNDETPLLVGNTPLTARAVFPPVRSWDENDTIIGASLPKTPEEGPEVLLLQRKDGTHHLALSCRGKFSAEFLPFDEKGLLPSRRFSVDLFSDESTLNIHSFQKGLDSTCSGWLYFLEEVVDNGEIGEELPYSPSEPCWTGVTNLLTEQKITGRQQVPEVWETDYAFVLCTPDQIFRLDELLQERRLNGLPVSCNQVFLRTQIDLLKLRAIHRVKNEWEDA